MKYHKDLSGHKYNMLTLVRVAGKNNRNQYMYECICDCGTTCVLTLAKVTSGHTKSCGCLILKRLAERCITHGKSNISNTEYEIWKGMKARCLNKKHKAYHRYGGRGISVCNQWINSFETFYADMGSRPSKHHSLDRYPNKDGNYEPTNCRWASVHDQARNTRTNRWIEYNGDRMILSDWASFFNVNPSTLSEHLKTKSFPIIHAFYTEKNNSK